MYLQKCVNVFWYSINKHYWLHNIFLAVNKPVIINNYIAMLVCNQVIFMLYFRQISQLIISSRSIRMLHHLRQCEMTSACT